MITPEQLAEIVQEDHANCVDMTPMVEDLQYVPTTAVGSHDRLEWGDGEHARSVHLNAVSRKQLIKELGGPTNNFLTSVCDEDLRGDVLRFLLNRYNEQNRHILIRAKRTELDGDELLQCRAVFPSNHTIFDNPALVNAMKDTMDDYSMEVATPDIGIDHMLFRAYYSDVEPFNLNGWDYRFGIEVVNSETGQHTPTIRAVVENLTQGARYYVDLEDGPLFQIPRSDQRHAATLATAVEGVPRVLFAELDRIKEALRQRAETEHTTTYSPLRFFAPLSRAKVSDPSRYIPELEAYVEYYRNGDERPWNQLHTLQAIARLGNRHDITKCSELAGQMIEDTTYYQDPVAQLLGTVRETVEEATV